MSGETRIPRDMCAGNTIPGETRITMTPVRNPGYVYILSMLQQTIQRMNTCNSYNNHWQLYRNTAFQWSLDFPLRSETDPFCVPVQNF